MIRRGLMRRAYNKGNWEKARYHAFKIVEQPKEQKLARSVIIRSYWNEREYEQVVTYANKWEDLKFHNYLEKAIDQLFLLRQKGQKIGINLDEYSLQRYVDLQKSQPKPKNEFNWNEENMTRNFSQEEDRIWFRYPEGYCYWDMPKGYKLQSTHSSLLELTAELLLSPWHPLTKKPFTQNRELGLNPSLSFSAGTDSTAAALLLPQDTILGYHKRSFESQLKHDNAQRLINFLNKEQNREILTVDSNHELIRTYKNNPLGFSTDLACASHLILMADFLNIGGIAFGMPLDNTWLWKGRTFRSFETSDYFQYWSERFFSAGLDLILPIAGISEAGAMKICQQSGLMPYLNSCLRSRGGDGCGECWKCFLKNGPLGRIYDFNSREIQTFLNRRPIPTATHALWTIKTLNLNSKVSKDLHPLLEMDLSWWVGVYPPAKQILPKRWRKEIWDKTQHYLENMPEPYSVEKVNLFNDLEE